LYGKYAVWRFPVKPLRTKHLMTRIGRAGNRLRYNAVRMTPELERRLYELVSNPPPDSKIAAAKAAGVNLMLMVRLLSLTPEQRIEEAERLARFQEQLEEALRRTKRGVIPDYELS
jgi:hypothetical protein